MSAAALYYLLNPKDTHKTGAPCVSWRAPWAGCLTDYQPVNWIAQVQPGNVDLTCRKSCVHNLSWQDWSVLGHPCNHWKVCTFCLLCI